MLSFDISTKPIEGTSLVAHTVKKLSAMQETETWVRAMGQEDPLDKETVNPLQYFCLENLIDRGACWATVHGITISQT